MANETCFFSWSGGKDSCLALDRYLNQYPDSDIILLTMLKENTQKTTAHGLSKELLLRQANALNKEIILGFSDFSNYEQQWGIELAKLKASGIHKGIFGDIDLQAHYDWIKRVLTNFEIEMLMPLWLNNRQAVVNEFIARAYRAQIISINTKLMPQQFLGKDINQQTVNEMQALGIDASGEGGEFHSFVYDGPLFKNKVDYQLGQYYQDGDYLYLELL
ncbi:MAG: hypothetical protein WAX77_05845 [Methylococcaceae bacterium]